MDQFVTWQAIHFGLKQKLTSKITAFSRPFYFKDEQIKGIFKLMVHDHYFETINETVVMRDVFKFESPFGFAGKLFNSLILTSYMRKLLINRNKIIKEFAETTKWQSILIQPLKS